MRAPTKTALPALLFSLTPAALAQNAPAPTPPADDEKKADELVPLEETVVTATRFEHGVFDLPRSVTVIDRQEIERRNQIVGLDALNESIGIWVEKRNGVSSDPVLRGFSGGNILALVDGDSLTSLWGEGGYAGDDMYGKVDGESIERIEVIRGPSSALYGSNNLGGVINFITRRAPAYTDAGASDFGGSLKLGFWGATNGFMTRGDTYGATDAFRYRLGYTLRDIGDTRGGGTLGLLSPSGVDESNFDWNSELRLSESDTLELNAQQVNRNGLPKYYKATQRNNNDRLGTRLAWRSTDIGFGDEMKWSVYYQNKEDERYWQDQPKSGVAKWESFATDFQTLTPAGDDHLLTWGLHAGRDLGESPDDEQFTITTPTLGTQKASPDSTWDDLGAYVQDEWTFADGWSLTGSVRFDFFRYEADGNVFYTDPGNEDTDVNHAETSPGTYDKSAVTGGLGLVRHLSPEWMAYGSWSRGYRLFAPGFGFRRTGYGILTPTDGLLDPTTADQFELGTRVTKSWWSASVAAYYSFLYEVQQPTQGSYDVDGDGIPDTELDGEPLYVTTGADGYVTGIEIDTAIDLGHFVDDLVGWSWHNGFMANYGRVKFDAGEEFLRHTHPPRFLSAVRWDDQDPVRGRWFELVADLVAPYTMVDESRLNSDVGYLNDPQDKGSGLINADGLPGYAVFHARGGVRLTEGIDLTVAVENLLDKEYRTAHSRMDAAGRNVIVGIKASF